MMIPIFLSLPPITVGGSAYVFDVDVTHFMKVAEQLAECIKRLTDVLSLFSFSVGFVSDFDVEINAAFTQFSQ